MRLTELKELLSDYPLNVFVGTPKAFSVDHDQLAQDTEKVEEKLSKIYLYNIADLFSHNNEFFSDNILKVRNYIARIIGTTVALRDVVQLCEDMTGAFDSKINWASALAVQSMITILNNLIEQLNIVLNQAKSSRSINRIRDRVSFIISQKLPEMLYILSTIIAIEMGQCQPSEIIAAIGRGIVIQKAC